ncbi:unnamed protein product, partial [Rotaria magnacalcarata]
LCILPICIHISAPLLSKIICSHDSHLQAC